MFAITGGKAKIANSRAENHKKQYHRIRQKSKAFSHIKDYGTNL